MTPDRIVTIHQTPITNCDPRRLEAITERTPRFEFAVDGDAENHAEGAELESMIKRLMLAAGAREALDAAVAATTSARQTAEELRAWLAQMEDDSHQSVLSVLSAKCEEDGDHEWCMGEAYSLHHEAFVGCDCPCHAEVPC